MTQPSKPLDDPSQPIDKLREIDELFLERILFIGEKLPDLSDERPKFVLLGIPADLLKDIKALVEAEIVEARIDESVVLAESFKKLKWPKYYTTRDVLKMAADIMVERIQHVKGKALKQPNQSNQDREV